jgi:glycosyl-4,4'-diaponeurosporenoate acyltransferase
MGALALPLSAIAVVGSSALGWLGWSLLVGYGGHRLSADWLLDFTALDGPAGGQDAGGRWLERLGIRRWKDRLPEAGAFFPGGTAKRSLGKSTPGRDAQQLTRQLQRFLVETRRAELVHLAIWPFWLATALWLPAAAVLVNLAFATAFNLPCLLVQRFNRHRLLRLLGRLATPNANGLREPFGDAPPAAGRKRSP